MLDQELPALILGQALLEPDVARFDLGEDLLELSQGLFEVLRRGLGFLRHAWDCKENSVKNEQLRPRRVNGLVRSRGWWRRRPCVATFRLPFHSSAGPGSRDRECTRAGRVGCGRSSRSAPWSAADRGRERG